MTGASIGPSMTGALRRGAASINRYSLNLSPNRRNRANRRKKPSPSHALRPVRSSRRRRNLWPVGGQRRRWLIRSCTASAHADGRPREFHIPSRPGPDQTDAPTLRVVLVSRSFGNSTTSSSPFPLCRLWPFRTPWISRLVHGLCRHDHRLRSVVRSDSLAQFPLTRLMASRFTTFHKLSQQQVASNMDGKKRL